MRKVKCALRPVFERMTGFCREHGHDSLRVLKEKMDLVEIANLFTCFQAGNWSGNAQVALAVWRPHPYF